MGNSLSPAHRSPVRFCLFLCFGLGQKGGHARNARSGNVVVYQETAGSLPNSSVPDAPWLLTRQMYSEKSKAAVYGKGYVSASRNVCRLQDAEQHRQTFCQEQVLYWMAQPSSKASCLPRIALLLSSESDSAPGPVITGPMRGPTTTLGPPNQALQPRGTVVEAVPSASW